MNVCCRLIVSDQYSYDATSALHERLCRLIVSDQYSYDETTALQEARMHMVSDSLCAESMAINETGIFVPHKMICAGYEHGYVTICNVSYCVVCSDLTKNEQGLRKEH